MSYSVYAAHLYGVIIGDNRFREEFKNIETDYGRGDQYGILSMIESGDFDELPPGFPESARDIEVFGGPGETDYVGYGARMPYENPIKSKEEMDESISDLMVYLYGEEIGKTFLPDDIYDTWCE